MEVIESLKSLFSKAKESVKIASPWIEYAPLEELLKLLSKDVKVEVVLRVGNKEDLEITGKHTFEVLRRYGADIYINPRLHAKLFIVDNSKALVGSSNLTRAGTVEGGNLEAVVEVEDREKVAELVSLFEDFKRQSIKLEEKAVGIVVKVESSTEAIALLFEDLPEQTLLWTSKYLCRLKRVYSQEIELPALTDNRDYNLSELYALLKPSLKFGVVGLLLELEQTSEGYFSTPIKPLEVGQQLFLMGEEKLLRVMKTNLSGYAMEIPVAVGRLVGLRLPVFVDLAKITTMHMAVMGTTGSGKTTFVRRLIEGIPEGMTKVYIFDLFGEYAQRLQIPEDRIEHIRVPYTLFPLWTEDFKELLKDYGLTMQERSEEERHFFASIRSHVKPDIKLIAYREKSLKEILLASSKGAVRKDIEDLLTMLARDYGEDSLENQREVCGLMEEALYSEKDIVVFDLKEVVNPLTRLNLVGLMLKELLFLARKDGLRRLVVLEEAHNFAPERGATEIPTGRENIAISMTKRIALEGRKFNLGLVAITQRPANLSKYVLSQLNTQAIFRLITKNDLEAVAGFFEYPHEDQLRLLPALKPGHLFLSGIGVPFSMLAEIEL